MLKKIILSLLFLYAVVGFILLPIILKPQITKAANQALNAKLSIEDIYINPIIFKVELEGVSLKDLDDKHLVSFKTLDVDVELYSLFGGTVHVKDIILKKPKISLVQNKDKSINLTKILKDTTEKKQQKEEAPSELPRIIIDKIAIENGAVSYKDFTNTKEFDFEISDLSFKLLNIDTNDFDNSGGTLRFHTHLGDSGVLDIHTKITGLKPLKIEGDVDFAMAKLYKELEYAEEGLGVEVANGEIYLHANYALNMDDLDNMLIDNMSLKLNKLRIKPKTQYNDVLNLASLHVEGVKVKPLQQDVYVDKVALDSLHVEASMDKDGVIDWVKWLPQKKKTADANATESVKQVDEKQKPWNVYVDKIALSKVSFALDDKKVKPSVKTLLNDFNLNINSLTLDGKKPFTYDMSLVLNDTFKCFSNGDIKHDVLELNSYLACKDFDITHYNPYINTVAKQKLKVYDVALKDAKFGFDVNASIKDENGTINAMVHSANVNIDKLYIDKKSTKEKLVRLKSFEIKDVSLDTKSKEVLISKTAINAFKLYVKKDKDSKLNLDNLLVPKEAKATKTKVVKKSKAQKPYHLKLKHFNINNTAISFKDESIKQSTTSTIDKITLNAYNIDSKKNSWLKYKISMRINKAGSVSSKGSLRHTPLKQKGEFSVKKLALKDITPYLQESMYVDIKDGYFSLDSKLAYEKSEKKPDLHVEGSMALESFELSDSRDDSTLLAFAKTDLKSFDLKLFPNSMYVDEVVLDSFYVDAQIDKNKTMNFAKLAKEQAVEQKEVAEKEDTNESKKTEPSFPFKLMKLHVKNGTANFEDFSLPIDFKTSMHNLNGFVYSISNSAGEISYINIDGEVDKYGSTKIKGSIDTSNIKSYTDIGVNFRNLALDSYSGYSAQFAGYKIDKGKLFLDLEYKIYDSQLLGKNSLIIKQIELGDEIEDENITKLPLSFAIALLEDSDGIIDINMPVEGDMDNPDFKYGALVLKTFANLIVKAVASPFKFLGEAMGFDGDKLKFAEFEPAKDTILAPEREKLDNIAKMLIKKPKISFGIVGAYDEKKDRYGLQVEKLKKDVLKRSDNEQKTGMTVDVLEEIYVAHEGEEKLDKLKESLKKKYEKDAVFNAEYEKEILNRAILTKNVSEDELKILAQKRADALKNYLVQNKNIDENRIVIEPIQSVESETEKYVQMPLKIVVK
jgi:uncharacterized protein involved in outer membrane biogenesis